MIIAYIFHDLTQKICSEHFELLSFVFVVGFRCQFFVRGSAHCIIYANLNFALDGTRGTLPLPFQSVLSSFSFRQLKPVMNMRGLDSEQQISQSALFALQKSSANLNTSADEK